MNRDELLRDLPLHLDGELPPGRAAEVRAALQRDPDLVQRARELHAVDRLLELHPSAVPSPGFVGRALGAAARADALVRHRPGWRRAGGIAGVAAAAAVLVIATGVFWRQDRPDAADVIPLRDYGVLAGRPQDPVPDADLDAAWREIESVSQIYLPLG